MKDGSIVTEIHRTHDERCCVVNYADNQEFTCSYNHILLIDVSNLPDEGKAELEQFCTFVPLEECYEINSDDDLSVDEKLIVDKFFHNEKVNASVRYIGKIECDIYEFAFSADNKKIIKVTTVTTKSEPQKVNENTYWLTCSGISYLMSKYKVGLYCNKNLINSVTDAGVLPCFCITTNTGRYET